MRLAERNPKRLMPYTNLLKAYKEKGDPGGAIGFLMKLIERKPNTAEPYKFLGQAFEAKGDESGAVATFSRLSKDPAHAKFALDELEDIRGKEEKRRLQSTPVSPRPPQAKAEWKPINPRLSCHMPFHLLQRIFIFASGDAAELSGAVAGVLQDAAENTHDDIMKQAKIDLISKSGEPTEILQTQKVPESALRAMAVLAPTLIAKYRDGEVRLCIRPFEDPPSGQNVAIFLLYNNP
jgi:hypothetical protein